MRRHGSSRVALVAVAVGAASCSHAPALEGRIAGLQERVEEAAERGGYYCAPRELAEARAHLHFAEIELSQGDQARAAEHLTLAEPNAHAALDLSPEASCKDRPDLDGDGIQDGLDACPLEPEDVDGVEDDDGCPDDLDTDEDGVPDSVDQCPDEPEDRDGYRDEDGCPDPDNDGDDLLDEEDRCPVAPEDLDGFEDSDGCPDGDNDFDSVSDADDECPNKPGPPAEKGCPKAYEDVEVTGTHIRITQKVYFTTGRAAIQPRSFELLNTVAQVLADYPDMRIEVQGHTDDRGSDRYNQSLSEKRARAVRAYLLGQGVAPSRATVKGYGEARPIEPNQTAAGRATNRRVELVRTDDAAVNKRAEGDAPDALQSSMSP